MDHSPHKSPSSPPARSPPPFSLPTPSSLPRPPSPAVSDIGQPEHTLDIEDQTSSDLQHRRWRSLDLPWTPHPGTITQLPSPSSTDAPTPAPTPPSATVGSHRKTVSDATSLAQKRNIRNISDPLVFPIPCDVSQLRELARKLGIVVLEGDNEDSLKRAFKNYFRLHSSKDAIQRHPELTEYFPGVEEMKRTRLKLAPEELENIEKEPGAVIAKLDSKPRPSIGVMDELEKLDTSEKYRFAVVAGVNKESQDKYFPEKLIYSSATSSPASTKEPVPLSNKLKATPEECAAVERSESGGSMAACERRDTAPMSADQLADLFMEIHLQEGGQSPAGGRAIDEGAAQAARFVREVDEKTLLDFQKLCPMEMLDYDSPSSLVESYIDSLRPSHPDVNKWLVENPFGPDALRTFISSEALERYEYTSLLRAYVFRHEPSNEFKEYLDGLEFTTDKTLEKEKCTEAKGAVRLAVVRRHFMSLEKLDIVEKFVDRLELKGKLLYHTTAVGNAEVLMQDGIKAENLSSRGDFGVYAFYMNTSIYAAVDWAAKRYKSNPHGAAILIFEWPNEEEYTFRRPNDDDWRTLVKNSRSGKVTDGYDGVSAIYGAQCRNPVDVRKGSIPLQFHHQDQLAVQLGTCLNHLIRDHLLAIVFFK